MPNSSTALGSLKAFLVGKPIPSRLADQQRLSRVTGLAVLSSDPLSSVAYATEEILRVLVLAGTGALWIASPIAAVIAGLMIIVCFSYRQTIHAYPGGGGAYSVARENLGTQAGLIAASALLLDYVMTVAVSIAAGVAALTSAFPQVHVNRVELALVFVAILAVGNLRGVRESGRIFAVSTYFFIGMMVLLITGGALRFLLGDVAPVPPPEAVGPAGNLAVLGVFLVLRAFSNGCTALTGVEAISNGVSAFRPPEARNAAATLMLMIGLAVTMFLGTTLLAQAYGVVPVEDETVVSQLARLVFGGRGVAYYLVQAATMLILVLAANTAYNDFPRLSSIVARDKFMPRQFMNQGDRLAFSNGIIVLSVLAGMLLIFFQGDTHALIPLYMIGVFVSFTLSQAGMVRKEWRERPARWRAKVAINAVGAVSTGVVLVVVAATKFSEGAWLILLLIPVQVAVFKAIRAHYRLVGRQLSIDGWRAAPVLHHTVVVPVGGMNRAVPRRCAMRARSRATSGRYTWMSAGAPGRRSGGTGSSMGWGSRSTSWNRPSGRCCRRSWSTSIACAARSRIAS